MGTHKYLWIPQYSWAPAYWASTKVRYRHGYHIYPTGRRRVLYYMYRWVPIDIPNRMAHSSTIFALGWI